MGVNVCKNTVIIIEYILYLIPYHSLPFDQCIWMSSSYYTSRSDLLSWVHRLEGITFKHFLILKETFSQLQKDLQSFNIREYCEKYSRCILHYSKPYIDREYMEEYMFLAWIERLSEQLPCYRLHCSLISITTNFH